MQNKRARRKRTQRNRLSLDRGLLEIIYLTLLPLLCVGSLMRGCAARSAEVPASAKRTQTAESGDASNVSGRSSDETGDLAGEGEDGYLADGTGTKRTGSGGSAQSVRDNIFDPDKFSYIDGSDQNITYLDDDYKALQGIDVSDHQGTINWKKVAGAGYEFVFVRLGFRGYGEEGTLNEDTKAVEYLRGAEAAGLQVGAYFFSQAVNEVEAEEEAEFAADIIEKSGVKLDLPLVYDPEFVPGVDGRANHITSEQVCQNTDAFRDTAEAAIHCKVALYSNLYWEQNMFDEETLGDYEIWYADYQDAPQTPYHFTWWQYTETGTVPGIKGDMDLNLWIRRMD